jgi:tetratricopeptide (TPR) repeat protein
MRFANEHRKRRLAPPALTFALAILSLGGLAALHRWAGDCAARRAGGDALDLALLRAEVDRQPHDVRARCRLGREELALGLHRDAERTLAPLLQGTSAPLEVRLLALDAALGLWRAAAAGSAERRSAEKNALDRLESFIPAAATREDVAVAARVALELGRPDIAAHAYERAALRERDSRAAIDLAIEALDAYRAADDGREALRVAEHLLDRFPGRPDLLLRAEAVALEQNEIGRATQIAEHLVAATPDDPGAHVAAARLSIWNDRPEAALRHWMWLARRGGDPEAPSRALDLARALRRGSDVAEILALLGRDTPRPRAVLAAVVRAPSTNEGRGAAAATSDAPLLVAGIRGGTSPAASLPAPAMDRSPRGAYSTAPRTLAQAVGAELHTESIAGTVFVDQRAFGRTAIAGGELEARTALIAYVSNAPFVRTPDAETRPSARFVIAGLGGATEITAGASLRSDRNLVQAGVARTQMLGSSGEARLETWLNEPADESLALRMHSVRARLGTAIAISEGHAYERVAIDAKHWTTRSGSAFGNGAVANLEVGWRASQLVLRLQGSYQRNSVSKGPLPGPLAGLDASWLLPDELALIGAGAGVPSLALGPVRLGADAWIGAVAPRLRPAFRVQAGLGATPFANGDLAVSGFAANDHLATGGNFGLTISVTHRFGI